jgi:hypothetical protein
MNQNHSYINFDIFSPNDYHKMKNKINKAREITLVTTEAKSFDL